MRTRLGRISFIAGVALAGMAVGRMSKGTEPGPADRAVQLAQEMAAAASHRDIKTLATLIPQSDRVAYVSNGHPITGKKYAETLGQYYGTLKVLDFKWEKWEVFPVGDKAAVFTGWASARTVDLQGKTDAGRALFTMVFADDGSGWKRVIAQKWQSQVPAVAAVHAAAPTERVPPASSLTVLFAEPVNATDKAFRLECPQGTLVAFTASPEPPGDGSSFLIHPAKPLTRGATCTLKVLAPQVSEPRFGQAMAADYTYEFKVKPG